eukprot:g2109.t1
MFLHEVPCFIITVAHTYSILCRIDYSTITKGVVDSYRIHKAALATQRACPELQKVPSDLASAPAAPYWPDPSHGMQRRGRNSIVCAEDEFILR